MPRKGLLKSTGDLLNRYKTLAGTITAVGGAVVLIYSAVLFGISSAKEQFGEWPYASRQDFIIVQVLTAGFQADRLGNEVRDIQSRIERLQVRRQVDPKFSVEDARELDYWQRQLRERTIILQKIEKDQRPYIQQIR